MIIRDFIQMLEAIQDKTPFQVGYHLLYGHTYSYKYALKNRMNDIIEGAGGIDRFIAFMRDIEQSEGAYFGEAQYDNP